MANQYVKHPCSHPECTGDHSNRTMDTCPAAREAYLRHKRDRYANDSEYRARIKEAQHRYKRDRYANDPEFRDRNRSYSRDYKMTAAGVVSSTRSEAKRRGNR